ncbi:hypothetical protein E2562_016597 [Oryza meyeriana var. granulata]|uniref:Uncharacterized protein n=1 Tax=Oryza meyeriana var. granulata TaxID=110450 RepID=A0A6G1C763_9ORYZ|nr:hypothetical protein E2562_016597 [Oryza meyeriana var. granulata]
MEEEHMGAPRTPIVGSSAVLVTLVKLTNELVQLGPVVNSLESVDPVHSAMHGDVGHALIWHVSAPASVRPPQPLLDTLAKKLSFEDHGQDSLPLVADEHRCLKPALKMVVGARGIVPREPGGRTPFEEDLQAGKLIVYARRTGPDFGPSKGTNGLGLDGGATMVGVLGEGPGHEGTEHTPSLLLLETLVGGDSRDGACGG